MIEITFQTYLPKNEYWIFFTKQNKILWFVLKLYSYLFLQYKFKIFPLIVLVWSAYILKPVAKIITRHTKRERTPLDLLLFALLHPSLFLHQHTSTWSPLGFSSGFLFILVEQDATSVLFNKTHPLSNNYFDFHQK